MEDYVQDALISGDYRLLSDIKELDSVEKSQLILNDPVEYMKYGPMSSSGLRMYVYSMLEDILFEEDVDCLLSILYDMKDENLIKLFDRKIFEINFEEATTMNFDDETLRKVDRFLQYVDDKRREYDV